MKCPHCIVEIHNNEETYNICSDKDTTYWIGFQICPSCRRQVMTLTLRKPHPTHPDNSSFKGTEISRSYIYPKAISRMPVSSEVPKKYSDDYKEACLVLTDSPKSSAALSRRCLQNIIRDELKIIKKNLNQEIDEVISNKKFTSHILQSIDAIRQIGNFAAHPIKSQTTGEIVEVEPGEAEWTLEVLEMIFDEQFVKPALIAAKRAALDAKLADAGKQPLK